MPRIHHLRRTAAIALVAFVSGVGAVAAQAADVYVHYTSGIYRMSTDNPAATPVQVTAAVAPLFQGIVGSCTSLYAIDAPSAKIVSVDPTTGATADVATSLGTGTPQGLVISADGTRLWWIAGSSIYTRLVNDPPTTAPTEIATITAIGNGTLLTRVGDKLVVRNSQGFQVLDASATPTTPTSSEPDYGSDRTYVTGNATRAFIEVGGNGSSYTIKSIDPATQTEVDLATSATAPGVMLAFDTTLWVFGGVTGVSAVNNLWSVPISATSTTLALTDANKVNGAALPGLAFGATTLNCPKAAAAPAPTATAAPTVSGTAALGSTLTGTNGTWAHDPTAYTYQWERCTVGNASSCTPITGATRATRLLQRGDVGKALRLAVTATNAHGKATAHSALTAEVTAGSLRILAAPGVSTNPTVVLRVPGPGTVTLTGTRSVSSGMRAAQTDTACRTVVRKVAKGGLVRLTCRPTAATQAMRYAGNTVTVRLRVVYRPTKGASQTVTRTIVLRPLTSPEPVTG